MRVNVYAEDLDIFVEWKTKASAGARFDGIALYMDAGSDERKPPNAVTFWMRQNSVDYEKVKAALQRAVGLIDQVLTDRESQHVPD